MTNPHHPEPIWRKSSRSNGQNNCVEIAMDQRGHRLVRDSKDPAGGVLEFSPRRWTAFTAVLRAERLAE